MIGLGSNRLSVCRRGGMRVTQAGRGGMEWLAGGRGPSWASPYSAQATAALKAQFPTQWQTIRDYGFAHPALVPFINEDPMLVCSLGIEGLPIRYFQAKSNATGAAAFKIRTFNWDDTFEVKFRYKDFLNQAYPHILNQGPNGLYYLLACFGQRTTGNAIYRIGNGTQYTDQNSASVTQNTLYVMSFNKNAVTINGSKYQNSSPYKYEEVASGNEYMSTFGSSMGYELYYGKHMRNGEIIHEYVPQGDNCLVDIVSAEKYEDTSGNKPYEIKYLLNGQPWSPS